MQLELSHVELQVLLRREPATAKDHEEEVYRTDSPDAPLARVQNNTTR
jgi:hypothetical protein